MPISLLNAYSQKPSDTDKQKKFSQDYYDVLKTFNNIAAKYPLLDKRTERDMIECYKNDREKLNSLLFYHNIRIVLNIARKYTYRTNHPADLLMNGARGLMEATKNFDLKKNIKFNTYATSWVFKYILMMFYSKSPVTGVNQISLNTPMFSAPSDDFNKEIIDYLTDYFVDNDISSCTTHNKNIIAYTDYASINRPSVSTPSTEYEEISNVQMINDVIDTISANPEFTEIDKEIIYNNLMTNNESIKNISEKFNVSTNEVNKRKRWVITNLKNVLSSKYNVNQLSDVI